MLPLQKKSMKTIHGGQEGDPSYEELPAISLVRLSSNSLPEFLQPTFVLDKEVDWEKTIRLLQSTPALQDANLTIQYRIY